MTQVYLRALELDDLERTYRWHNDPELYRTLIGSFYFVSHTTEEQWLKQKQSFSSSEINLAICLKNNSLHIGNIYLRKIDWVSRNGELHIFIGESNQRGQGYGGEAVKLISEYAFNELGLIRLHLLVLEENYPAIRIYEKCGFVIEGKLRRHVYKNGKLHNALFMGLCADDKSHGIRLSSEAEDAL